MMITEDVRQLMRRGLKCTPCGTELGGVMKKLQKRWVFIELLLHGFVVNHGHREVGFVLEILNYTLIEEENREKVTRATQKNKYSSTPTTCRYCYTRLYLSQTYLY